MDQLLLYLKGLDPILLYPILSILVFLVVKILHKLGFLKDGNYQRIGVVVGTFMTSELMAETEKAIGGVLVGLIAVGINEFSGWVGEKVKNQ